MPDSELSHDFEVITTFESNGSFSNIDSIRLHYSINGNAFQNVKFESTNNSNEYSAFLPAPGENSIVNYYFCYESNEFCFYYPDKAPYELFTFTVGADNTEPVITLHNSDPHISPLHLPYSIIIDISDKTGIDTAIVEYVINENIVMYAELNKHSGNTYLANINPVEYITIDISSISYRVIAFDSAIGHNNATCPNEGYKEIYIVQPIEIYSGIQNLVIENKHMPALAN